MAKKSSYASFKTESRTKRSFSAWHWLAISSIVLVLDQISKILVNNQIMQGNGVLINHFFNIVHVRNPGAAFSFLAQADGWQIYFLGGFAALVAFFIVILLFKSAHQTLFSLALSCILAGAVGNLIDRIAYGAVIDFLDLHYLDFHWPAFNVADIAITLGAGLLILDEFRRVRRDRRINT
jgi:signal peptidase II